MDRKGFFIIVITILAAFGYDQFIAKPKRERYQQYLVEKKKREDEEKKQKEGAGAPRTAPPVQIVVKVQLPGASPETIASSITAPLEKEVGALEGIVEKASNVTGDVLALTLNFKPGSDVAKAQADVQAKVDEAKKKLPAEAVVVDVSAFKPGAALENPAVVKPGPVVEKTPGRLEQLSNEAGTVLYEFTEDGGGIARVTLKEHLVDIKRGTNVVLNEFSKMPIGATTSEIARLTAAEPDFSETTQRWKMLPVKAGEGLVEFERIDPYYNVKITKRYLLPRAAEARRDRLKGDYTIKLEIVYENLKAQQMNYPAEFIHVGGASPVSVNDQALYQGFDWYREGKNSFQPVTWFKGGGFIFKDPPRLYFQQDTDSIRWVAATSQYFTSMITALAGEDQKNQLGTSTWARSFVITPEQWASRGHVPVPPGHELHEVDVAMQVPKVILDSKGEPGATVTRSYQIYAGPREYRRLRLLDHDESAVLDYGTFLGIPTGLFSRMLLGSMNGLYNITKSYALAIVFLTIIVKAILWPLQSKANKNMKKMAAMNPQMKELQAKYKEDPAKFQQEMGKLWKKAGVNPLGGCWPILIQIPIFIGFYNMLGKAVELRHHGFWWVTDLSAPDTVAHLMGLPINPLPLLMAATMIIQMKVAPQGGDPAQRKIMMFLPLIFIVMCYDFASALALYWTVQNIISIVQLLINRNKEGKQVEFVPAK